MRFSPGCGCCCVDLTVDDDQTSKWERVDYGDTTTVTILTPVDLCNFAFNVKGEQVGLALSPWAAFSGSIRIYFLADPDDDSVDAIGELEITTENAWNSSYERIGALPFYEPAQGYAEGGFGTVDRQDDNEGARSVGDGTFVCSAMGLNQSFTQHGFFFNTTDGLSIYSYYDRVVVQGNDSAVFEEHSTTTIAGVENLGSYLVFLRSSCTAQKVYIRYEVDGDLSQTTTEFTLQTLNEVGDRSCRTDTDYYTEPAEEGNCTTPPVLCDSFRSQKPVFATIHAEIEFYLDPPEDRTWVQAANDTVWLTTPYTYDLETDPNSSQLCTADHLPQFLENGTPGTLDYESYSWWFVIVMSCESGVTVATIYGSAWENNNSTGFKRWEAKWEIELPMSITEPNQIPETLLNEANSTEWFLAPSFSTTNTAIQATLNEA